jgi:hypothetical protein
MSAGAPLLHIIAHVLTIQTDSSKPVHLACNLMVTCKAFQSALKECMGVLPLSFWPGTVEQAAGFAGASSTSAVPACGVHAAALQV